MYQRYRITRSLLRRCVSYVQGQSPTAKTREYFYYIDHQGQVCICLINSSQNCSYFLDYVLYN